MPKLAARAKNKCKELEKEGNGQRDEAMWSLPTRGSNGLDASGDMASGGGWPRQLSIGPRVRV